MRISGPLFQTALFACVAIWPVAAQVDVLTRHNDNARTGFNGKETQLNKSNVKNGTFGKLAFRLVDGNPYAQPLIVTGASAGGGATKTLAIIATEHNSVYAFDADDVNQGSTTAMVWHVGPNVLGNHIEALELYTDIGIQTCTDITTEIGITSTPAIQLTKQDAPKEGVVYVAAKSKPNGIYTYTLFALRLSDGTKLGQVTIQGQVPGTGPGSTIVNGKGVIQFRPKFELNRPAMLLVGNKLYVSFSGHCDKGAYHGWVFVYDVSSPAALKRVAVFCDTRNKTGLHEGRGGIWMSGEGPAVDDSGEVYLATGDGSFDGKTEFADSVLKLNGATLQPDDWFTPQNQNFLKDNDVDLGSGGVVLLPNSHLMLAGGKEGRMFLIDRDDMGKGLKTSVHSIQVTHTQDGPRFYNLHGTPVIWPRNGEIFIYVNGEENPFFQYRLVPDTTPGSAGWKFDPPDHYFKSTVDCATRPVCLTSPYPNYPGGLFGQPNRDEVWMPGGFMTVTSNGDDEASGIVWVAMPYADNANRKVARGVLRALDASDISKPELWDSENTGDPNDRLGQFAKFCPPTAVNGKVYLVTFQQETIMQDGIHTKTPPPGDQPALVIYGPKAAQ